RVGVSISAKGSEKRPIKIPSKLDHQSASRQPTERDFLVLAFSAKGEMIYMNRKMSVFSITLTMTILFGASLIANAQATRTWVSGVGDDANPCSRTAPCKTFAGAIAKTATGSEIDVLDPGGFGAVTITKSISIESQDFMAGVLVSGTNGIVINAP